MINFSVSASKRPTVSAAKHADFALLFGCGRPPPPRRATWKICRRHDGISLRRRVRIKHAYIAELRELAVSRITRPERYFLLAATGDEVLDWREMAAHYAGARQHVIDGSDHGISEFADYLDEVLDFCRIPPAGAA